MPLDYRFDEQVVLITGGARGLGQTFAEALARAGATVTILPGRYLQQKRPG